MVCEAPSQEESNIIFLDIDVDTLCYPFETRQTPSLPLQETHLCFLPNNISYFRPHPHAAPERNKPTT